MGFYILGQAPVIYSNAGHPQPILLHANGSIDSLDKGGSIIGLGAMIPFEEEEIRLQKGDKVILYSDGVTELANANGELFGIDRLLELLRGNVGQPIETLLETVHLSLMGYAGTEQPKDDISLLGIEFDGEEKNERKVTKKKRFSSPLRNLSQDKRKALEEFKGKPQC